MRIFHLVLFSDAPHFLRMQRDLVRLYARWENQGVTTVFYRFDPLIAEGEFHFRAGLLRIGGTESYIPGILKKTLLAISYFRGNFIDYDFIVRSNVSTVINFELLLSRLAEEQFHYGGPLLYQLCWKDSAIGIHDDRYFGTTFAAGSTLIFSSRFLLLLLADRMEEELDFSIVDDIAFGVLIRARYPQMVPMGMGSSVMFMENNCVTMWDSKMIVDEKPCTLLHLAPHIISFRNHTQDREQDADRVASLCDFFRIHSASGTISGGQPMQKK